ncbi:hypothetical protein AAON49_00695 [Pseudotenacibaculum sp. MALMAid0570]|uniref:toxin-antitoxin system YwqK family antitoxin n=1 Tax=Pseudotenacibaculum sp. MALMAid0570 TaxID=3143938 RepID=UPI0032DFF0B4
MDFKNTLLFTVALFLVVIISNAQEIRSMVFTHGAEREEIPKIKDTIREYYKETNILEREKYRDEKNLYIVWYSKEGHKEVMKIFPLDNLKKKTNLYYNNKGILVFRVGYNHGVISGIYEKFYDDGTAKIKGSYIRMAKDGVWKHYNQKGILIRKEVYKKGALLSKCEYFKQ